MAKLTVRCMYCFPETSELVSGQVDCKMCVLFPRDQSASQEGAEVGSPDQTKPHGQVYHQDAQQGRTSGIQAKETRELKQQSIPISDPYE